MPQDQHIPNFQFVGIDFLTSYDDVSRSAIGL